MAETLEVDVSELLYASKPDVDRQRRIITAVLLCVLAFVAWVIFCVLRRKGNHLQSVRYDPRLNAFLLMAVRPTAFLLLGAAAGALLSVWRNLHPTTVKMRRWILAIGRGFLLTYLILAIVSFCSGRFFMDGCGGEGISLGPSFSRAPFSFAAPGEKQVDFSAAFL
ncbi:MAG: hypothetical protein HFF07_01910 [Oscillospiraceae bacterium]|nr:hypothetical protein [Oscillospiraceae bacterium]